jgi:hypothetical protein
MGKNIEPCVNKRQRSGSISKSETVHTALLDTGSVRPKEGSDIAPLTAVRAKTQVSTQEKKNTDTDCHGADICSSNAKKSTPRRHFDASQRRRVQVKRRKREEELLERSVKTPAISCMSMRRIVYGEIVPSLIREGAMKRDTRVPASVVEGVLRHVTDQYAHLMFQRSEVVRSMSGSETLKPEHIKAQRLLMHDPCLQWSTAN